VVVMMMMNFERIGRSIAFDAVIWIEHFPLASCLKMKEPLNVCTGYVKGLFRRTRGMFCPAVWMMMVLRDDAVGR